MRILIKDYKGKVRVKVESKEDIYYLSKIIKEGDKAGMLSLRTTSCGEKGDKKRVYIVIKIEKMNVDYKNGCIRLLGNIEEAPEDVLHGYHSFDVCVGSTLDLYKDWKGYEKILLKKSEKQAKIMILAIAMDEKNATFGEITHLKVHELFTIKSSNQGKYIEGEDNKEYYHKIIKAINQEMDKYEHIIIAGPGFAKENLYKMLPDEIKRKVHVDSVSVTGITGLNEIIKRGILEKILKETTISEEMHEVESFFTLLSKDDKKVCYGFKNIEEVLEMGALEKLIVVDELLSRDNIEKIMEKAEKSRTDVKVISSEHEGGKRLLAIGGIAGILRYEINY